MKVVSLLLSVRPECLPEVREQLSAMPGVLVHGEPIDSRLVVTVEDTSSSTGLMQPMLAAQGLSGVLATTLTYEFCDEETIPLEKRS